MVLWYVHHDLGRFAALKARMVNISEKMLYQQLRELERDGLLVRFIAGPRHVEYVLTPLAQSLVPVLRALENWSRENDVAARWLVNDDATGS